VIFPDEHFLRGAWVQVASAISSFGIIYQKKGVAHVPIPPIKC
jgi:hypothetical protein